jgi:hypothetical protein
MIKQWHKQQIDLFRMIQPQASSNVCKFYWTNYCFWFSSALVLFLGEHAGFEPYTKVGVIVPVHGTLDIETSSMELCRC